MKNSEELPFTGERFVPQQEGELRAEHLHRYGFAAGLAAGRRVLDIACGEGYGSDILAGAAESVVGVDAAADVITHALQKYRRKNLSFIAGSCENIPLEDKSVDMAVSFETLEHVSAHEKMISELRRVLSPGGLLVISTPNRPVYSGAAGNKNPFHVRELDAAEFEKLLKRHFRNVAVCGQRFQAGSYIFPPEAKGFSVLGGSGGPEQAMYLIAFASDEPLPAVPASLFDGSALSEDKDGIIRGLNAEIEKLGKWGKSLDEKLLKLRDSYAALDEENRRRGEWGKRLDREIEELRKNLAGKDAIISASETEIENLKKTGAELEAGLRKENSALSGLNKKLTLETGRLRENIAEKERITSSAKAEIENLKKTGAESEAALRALRESCVALNEDNVKRGEWGTGLNLEIEELRKTLAEKTAFAAASAEHAASLSRSLEEKENIIGKIKSSTSWKFGAPVRLAGRLAKKPSRVLRGAAPLFFGFCAGIYRRLPFPRKTKLFLKSVFLRTLGPGMVSAFPPHRQETQEEFWAGHSAYPLRFAAAAEPEATIIITAHGRARLTYDCLKSVAEHTPPGSYEVVAVDDLSPDATARMLSSIPGLRVLKNKKNLGFLKSCNLAAKHAAGRYIVLLNNDTVVKPRWLEELLGTLKSVPGAGLVGAKLLRADGRLLEAGGIVWRDASAWNYGRGDDSSKPEYNYLRDADYCSAACVALPKALWQKLGGFDELYSPAYYEDTDLAFRVRAAGFRVLYQPLSKITHFENGSHDKERAQILMAVNREKFRKRWERGLSAHRPNGENPGAEKDRRVKKRILVIDACTITPDQDSGSMDVFHHLGIFRELGYQAAFAPDNLSHAKSYTEDLQRAGVECLHHPQVSSLRAHLQEQGSRYDAVIIYRHYVAARHIDDVRKFCPRARILFETVDLHFLREKRRAEMEKDRALAEKAEHTRLQEISVAAKADAVIVMSSAEKERLLAENPALRVEIIRPPREICGCANPFELRRDIMFVGGFRHPPNADAAVYFVAEIFPLIRRRLPGVKFHLLGSRAPEAVLKLACGDVLVHGYVRDIAPYFNGCRLSVAPLRYGAGVKGKVIQSLCCGLPTVGTPAAYEGMELADGRDMLEAATPEDFADAVAKLYSDKALWEKISANGLEAAGRLYSVEAALEKFRALLGP